MATHVVAAARRTFRELHGVVVKAGFMDKTVKVRVGGQKWNTEINKHFDRPKRFLVHDPNNSLRTGDVVAITPGWRTSKTKRHVVKHIIAPAGIPIEERNPVPTEEERWATALSQKEVKAERKAANRARKAAEQATLEETDSPHLSSQGGGI